MPSDDSEPKSKNDQVRASTRKVFSDKSDVKGALNINPSDIFDIDIRATLIHSKPVKAVRHSLQELMGIQKYYSQIVGLKENLENAATLEEAKALFEQYPDTELSNREKEEKKELLNTINELWNQIVDKRRKLNISVHDKTPTISSLLSTTTNSAEEAHKIIFNAIEKEISDYKKNGGSYKGKNKYFVIVNQISALEGIINQIDIKKQQPGLEREMIAHLESVKALLKDDIKSLQSSLGQENLIYKRAQTLQEYQDCLKLDILAARPDLDKLTFEDIFFKVGLSSDLYLSEEIGEAFKDKAKNVKQEKTNIAYGPLPKNNYTRDFEKIVKMLLEENASFALDSENNIITFQTQGKEEKFDLNEILSNFNPQQLEIDDFSQSYLEFLQHGEPVIKSTFVVNGEVVDMDPILRKYNNLNKTDIAALNIYSGPFYAEMNTLLRTKDINKLGNSSFGGLFPALKGKKQGKKEIVKESILAIAFSSAALNKLPEKHVNHTLRGDSSLPSEVLKEFKDAAQSGGVVHFSAFTSTTKGSIDSNFKGRVYIAFNDVYGRPISDFSQSPGEDEIVLKPGDFRINGYKETNLPIYFANSLNQDILNNIPEDCILISSDGNAYDFRKMQPLLDKDAEYTKIGQLNNISDYFPENMSGHIQCMSDKTEDVYAALKADNISIPVISYISATPIANVLDITSAYDELSADEFFSLISDYSSLLNNNMHTLNTFQNTLNKLSLFEKKLPDTNDPMVVSLKQKANEFQQIILADKTFFEIQDSLKHPLSIEDISTNIEKLRTLDMTVSFTNQAKIPGLILDYTKLANTEGQNTRILIDSELKLLEKMKSDYTKELSKALKDKDVHHWGTVKTEFNIKLHNDERLSNVANKKVIENDVRYAMEQAEYKLGVKMGFYEDLLGLNVKTNAAGKVKQKAIDLSSSVSKKTASVFKATGAASANSQDIKEARAPVGKDSNEKPETQVTKSEKKKSTLKRTVSQGAGVLSDLAQASRDKLTGQGKVDFEGISNLDQDRTTEDVPAESSSIDIPDEQKIIPIPKNQNKDTVITEPEGQVEQDPIDSIIQDLINKENLNSENVKISKFKGGEKHPFEPGREIYQDRVKSIFEAGLLLIDDLIHEQHKDEYKSKLNVIKSTTCKELENFSPESDSDHKMAVTLISEATKNIAEIFKYAEKNYALKDSSSTLEDDWLSVLQQREFNKISSTQRNILIHKYPDGHGGYMVSYAKPLSNISSLSRKGDIPKGNPELPNFWKTTSIHIDGNGKELSRRTMFRSASLTPFEVKDKKTRLKLAGEIAKFEMQQYALDRVLSKNPKTEIELKQALEFDYLKLSLQSIIYPENTSILETEKTLSWVQSQANQGKLNFTDSQLKTLKNALSENFDADKIDEILNKNLAIRPKTHMFNMGTNVTRGADLKGDQDRINKQTFQFLQNKVLEIVGDDIENQAIKDILQTNNPLSKANLKLFKEVFELEKNSYKLENQKIISDFIWCFELSNVSQKYCFIEHENNNSKTNYLKQEAVASLAEKCGVTVNFGCQSGKDRTGCLFAVTEAAQIERDQNAGKINIEAFWGKTLPNAVKYSISRAITSINCPGAKGMQGLSYPMILPEAFQEAIHAKIQDMASRLHKAPYDHKSKITNNPSIVRSIVYDIANKLDSPFVTLDKFKNILNISKYKTKRKSEIEELEKEYHSTDDSDIKELIVDKLDETIDSIKTSKYERNDIASFELEEAAFTALNVKLRITENESERNYAKSNTPIIVPVKQLHNKVIEVASAITNKERFSADDVGNLKDLIELAMFHSGVGEHADSQWTVPESKQKQFAIILKQSITKAFLQGGEAFAAKLSDQFNQYCHENSIDVNALSQLDSVSTLAEFNVSKELLSNFRQKVADMKEAQQFTKSEKDILLEIHRSETQSSPHPKTNVDTIRLNTNKRQTKGAEKDFYNRSCHFLDENKNKLAIKSIQHLRADTTSSNKSIKIESLRPDFHLNADKPVNLYLERAKDASVKYSVDQNIFQNDPDGAQLAIKQLCRIALGSSEPNAVLYIPENLDEMKAKMVKDSFDEVIQEELKKPDGERIFDKENMPRIVDTKKTPVLSSKLGS